MLEVVAAEVHTEVDARTLAIVGGLRVAIKKIIINILVL